ncbi:unnamed protein product [Gordionus sp. m RMFG-2023]|uniref:neogenin-like n=1 Tax=Gordionus sp. m RMFG-2023 TaxID=3053472 RepID=UPI0030E3FF56
MEYFLALYYTTYYALLLQTLIGLGQLSSIRTLNASTTPSLTPNISFDLTEKDVILFDRDNPITENTVITFNGQSVILNCSVHKNDSVKIRYDWLKDGHLLPPFTSPYRRSINVRTGQLTIKDVRADNKDSAYYDSGTYQCMVTVDRPGAHLCLLSSHIKLVVASLGPLIPSPSPFSLFSPSPSSKFSTPIHPLIIPIFCRTKQIQGPTIAPLQVTWLKDGAVLKITPNVYGVIPLAGNEEGYAGEILLVIHDGKTRKEGNNPNGKYRCKIEIPLEAEYSPEVVVDFKKNVMDTTLAEPFFLVKPWDITYTLSRSSSQPLSDFMDNSQNIPIPNEDLHPPHGIRIPCVVSGFPVPDIVWLKNGLELSRNHSNNSSKYRIVKAYASASFLHIMEPTVHDAGIYTCRTFNTEDSVDASIHVKILVPPSLLLTPVHFKHLKADSDLSLTCLALGHPKPVITWFKDGVLIDSDSDYIRIDSRNNQPFLSRFFRFSQLNWENLREYLTVSRLHILGTVASDSGFYQCFAGHQNLDKKPFYTVTSEVLLSCDGTADRETVAEELTRTTNSNALLESSATEINNKLVENKFASPSLKLIRKTNQTVMLEWSLPANALYGEYHIQYGPVNSKRRRKIEINYPSTTESPSSPVLGGQISMTGLTPDTEYRFELLNRRSDKANFNVLLVRTLGTPKLAVNHVTSEPGPPTNLKAWPTSSTSIKITWEPPVFPDKRTFVFTVHIKRLGSALAYFYYLSSRRYAERPKAWRTGESRFSDPFDYDSDNNNRRRIFETLESTRRKRDYLDDFHLNEQYLSDVLVLHDYAVTNASLKTPIKRSPVSPQWPLYEQSYDFRPESDLHMPEAENGETEGSEEAVNVRGLWYHASHLIPFSYYSVRVSALLVTDDDKPGAEKSFITSPTPRLIVRTLSDVPSAPPLNVTLAPLSSSAIIARWQPPLIATLNGILTGYKVRFRGPTPDDRGVITVDARETRAAISGLKEGVRYAVRVSAITVNGSGVPSEWVSFTLPPVYFARHLDESRVPDSPGSLKVLPLRGGAKIFVRWTAPANHNDILVRGYTLGYGIGVPDIFSRVLSPAVTSYTLVDLVPGSEYVISLRAFNNRGNGRERLETVKTLPKYGSLRDNDEGDGREEESVLLPPIGLEALTMSESVISLSWSDTADLSMLTFSDLRSLNRLETRLYTVRYNPSSASLPFMSSDDLHSTSSSIYKYINVTRQTKSVIQGLKPNTQYEFVVKVAVIQSLPNIPSVQNSDKNTDALGIIITVKSSTWSLSAFNTTGEAPPGSPPRDLTVFGLEPEPPLLSKSSTLTSPPRRTSDKGGDGRSCCSVFVNWQPPKQANGKIMGYLVFYTTQAQRPDREWIVETVKGHQLTTLVRELTPDTSYHFKIQARNSKGFGPLSPVVYFKTPSVPNTMLGQFKQMDQVMISNENSEAGLILEDPENHPSKRDENSASGSSSSKRVLYMASAGAAVCLLFLLSLAAFLLTLARRRRRNIYKDNVAPRRESASKSPRPWHKDRSEELAIDYDERGKYDVEAEYGVASSCDPRDYELRSEFSDFSNQPRGQTSSKQHQNSLLNKMSTGGVAPSPSPLTPSSLFLHLHSCQSHHSRDTSYTVVDSTPCGHHHSQNHCANNRLNNHSMNHSQRFLKSLNNGTSSLRLPHHEQSPPYLLEDQEETQQQERRERENMATCILNPNSNNYNYCSTCRHRALQDGASSGTVQSHSDYASGTESWSIMGGGGADKCCCTCAGVNQYPRSDHVHHGGNQDAWVGQIQTPKPSHCGFDTNTLELKSLVSATSYQRCRCEINLNRGNMDSCCGRPNIVVSREEHHLNDCLPACHPRSLPTESIMDDAESSVMLLPPYLPPPPSLLTPLMFQKDEIFSRYSPNTGITNNSSSNINPNQVINRNSPLRNKNKQYHPLKSFRIPAPPKENPAHKSNHSKAPDLLYQACKKDQEILSLLKKNTKSTEDLNTEMQNLEGLIQDMNTITSHNINKVNAGKIK